ncbi:14980_t:CDS:2 [Funneliformis geosporum]|nr:14980_t:CDS:2 [Funneliformis geosporum]
MVRKIRSDKKDTTCDLCGRILANPNKLPPIQASSIQESNQ